MAETAADRVATFVEAFMANPYRHGHPAILTIAGEATGHKDLSLDANDVAETVTPELRLLATMRAIVASDHTNDVAFRYGTANEVMFRLDLDEDALEDLAEKLREVREALDMTADRVGVFLHGKRRRRYQSERREQTSEVTE